ncbi:MAG: hypothetical protein ACFE95_17655, partial [Candidatus Hodarchaeota archaeon]
MTGNAEYVAGSCNIGSAEINQRKRIGFIGLSITGFGIMVYIPSIIILNINPLLGILFIFPGTLAS